MLAMGDFPAFRPLVLFSVLWVVNTGAAGFATANARRKAKGVLNPEDTTVDPGSRAASEEAPDTLRAKRAQQNDVENLPAFLVLALLLTLTGGSATAGCAYFGVHFAGRTQHTIFYLNAVQRTAALFAGQIVQIAMIVQLPMRVS
jgi:uncharacterized MAPEG superfamily protein